MSFLISAFLMRLALAGLPADTVPSHPVVSRFDIMSGYEYMTSSYRDELTETVPDEDKTNVSSAAPVHLRYSFSFTNPHVRNYLPGGYQGLGISLMNIGAFDAGGVKRSSRYIGYPTTLYVFQGGPFWKIDRRFHLDYEWNFGASFGWKPFNADNHHYNLVVGSRVNAYLNISMLINWQISSHVSVFGGVTLNHFSNGNTSWPNPGVNSPGIRIGAQYLINPQKDSFPEVLPDTVRKKVFYDLSLWGASRKRVYLGGERPVLLNGHYACAGITFSPLVRLNRWWKVGGALDLQWDESSDFRRNYAEGNTSDDIKFYHPAFLRQASIGLSAHGELQMPIFSVNIGIGCNLLAPEENRGTYQNITLKTYLTDFLYLNVGYQLRNFRQQAHLMLGMGVSF